jgi:hypothetical protein
MPNLAPRQEDAVLMWSACVQTAHNSQLSGRITSQNNHRPAYINNLSVHKTTTYTLTHTASNHLFTLSSFTQNNRVKSALMPTIHRPYIENKKLLLKNILLERA